MKARVLIPLVLIAGTAGWVAWQAIDTTSAPDTLVVTPETHSALKRAEADASPKRARVAIDTPQFTPVERKALHGPKGDYLFSERRYAPALLLPDVSDPASPAHLTSPELVLAHLYSAMKRGDFDGALALFDDASRIEFLAEPELRPVYERLWREQMVGHDFQLTRRVDFTGAPGIGRAPPREALGASGATAVGWAAIYKQDGDGPELASPHALVQLPDGTWRLTNALVDHPVYAHDERQTDVTVQTLR